ncbi:hypothetical protein DL770_009495 [Monosporascus sp. CRB-9-2]|nr:hypothetical protein DL770_009495 [Monosporascus sp. CRB-9-2]
MSALLSPPRVVLLAVHLATKSNINSLTALASQHSKVLHKELLLRILLTCLPETLPPNEYVSLVERIESGYPESDHEPQEVDWSSVADITDEEATKKVRKLKLLRLAWKDAPEEALDDPITLFLIHRAYRVDEEAGLLTQLPDLIVPFLNHAPCIRTWMMSALLPLLRRNHSYYPEEPIPHTLAAFEHLDDRTAVSLLLSQTGAREEELASVGRDLRGLIGPWLYNETRWKRQEGEGEDAESGYAGGHLLCPGWEQVLEWLIAQASRSWKIAVKAVEQWDGPGDVDWGEYGTMWLRDEQQGYMERRYARAVLAAAYLIPESSVEALSGVNSIITKVTNLLDQDPCPTLQVASSLLPPFGESDQGHMLCAKNATYMRNGLLEESNPLTTPSEITTRLLHTLTISAFILTKAGVPCTVRRAGELAFLQDEREQKAEAVRFIHSFSNKGPKNDDKYWIRARNELLWLRDWGAEESSGSAHARPQGVFGQLKREFLEIECLKAFLFNSRYSLARSIYEDSPEKPLDDKVLQDTVIASAMHAYDNATNPNRGRGGLLKCDDIIHAFPKIVGEASPDAKRIEALLSATHALGEYRLVLKQGEPFTPVILRIHSDPISIIGKVLEQNPKSYTRMQDFLRIGTNIVDAALTVKNNSALTPDEASEQKLLAEKRITAMCIDAALAEDDFETAYSYVVNRLAAASHSAPKQGNVAKTTPPSADEYSWKAALQAGKYRRTAQTLRPTHIGTASGNLEIRHLEQRIECLSTAIRIAPPATLPEIINVFRKCEEELNAAVIAEEAQESAWDDRGDMQTMPGAFSQTVPAGVVRSGGGPAKPARHGEEAPMSLFDLSRASMARAQRNLTALSSLQQSKSEDTHGDAGAQQRVRKRDALREAAVGTLASGVGWLIGAQPVDRNTQRD